MSGDYVPPGPDRGGHHLSLVLKTVWQAVWPGLTRMAGARRALSNSPLTLGQWGKTRSLPRTQPTRSALHWLTRLSESQPQLPRIGRHSSQAHTGIKNYTLTQFTILLTRTLYVKQSRECLHGFLRYEVLLTSISKEENWGIMELHLAMVRGKPIYIWQIEA